MPTPVSFTEIAIAFSLFNLLFDRSTSLPGLEIETVIPPSLVNLIAFERRFLMI